MNVIQNINTTTFSLNGVRYLKNYVSRVSGSRVEVFNVYDRKETLIPLTHFAEFTVNGVIYESATALQIALLYQLYYRNNLVPGGDPSDYAALESQMAALQDDMSQTEENITALQTTAESQSEEISILQDLANNMTNYRPNFWPYPTPPTEAEVVAFINEYVTFTVSPIHSRVYIRFFALLGGAYYQYIFDFGGGKGVWGANLDDDPVIMPVTLNRIKLISVFPVTLGAIQENDEALILPLGEIPQGGFLASVNQEEHDFTDDGRQYYFSYYIEGILYLALFIGAPGVYGGGSLDSDDFSASDFAQVTNSNTTTLPTLEAVTQSGNMTGNPFGVYTEGASLLFQPDGFLFTGANGKTAKLRMNDVEANAQFNFPEDKAGGHTVAMLSDVLLAVGKIVKTGKGFVVNGAGVVVPNTGSFAVHEKGDLFKGISTEGKFIPYMRYKGIGNVNNFENHYYEMQIHAVLPDEPGYDATEE